MSVALLFAKQYLYFSLFDLSYTDISFRKFLDSESIPYVPDSDISQQIILFSHEDLFKVLDKVSNL